MNCKHKLLHCNANTNFNKIYLKKELTSKFAEIRIKNSNNNQAANRTKYKRHGCVK